MKTFDADGRVGLEVGQFFSWNAGTIAAVRQAAEAGKQAVRQRMAAAEAEARRGPDFDRLEKLRSRSVRTWQDVREQEALAKKFGTEEADAIKQGDDPRLPRENHDLHGMEARRLADWARELDKEIRVLDGVTKSQVIDALHSAADVMYGELTAAAEGAKAKIISLVIDQIGDLHSLQCGLGELAWLRPREQRAVRIEATVPEVDEDERQQLADLEARAARSAADPEPVAAAVG